MHTYVWKFSDILASASALKKLSSGFIYYAIQGIPPLGIPACKLFAQAAAVVAADAGRPAVVPCPKITEALGFGIKTESIWMLPEAKRLLLVLNYLEHSHCF